MGRNRREAVLGKRGEIVDKMEKELQQELDYCEVLEALEVTYIELMMQRILKDYEDDE